MFIRQILFLEEVKAVSDIYFGIVDDSLDVIIYQIVRKRIGGNSYFIIINKLCVFVGEFIIGIFFRSGKYEWKGGVVYGTKVYDQKEYKVNGMLVLCCEDYVKYGFIVLI